MPKHTIPNYWRLIALRTPKFVGQVEYVMVGYIGVDYDLVDYGNVDCSRVDYCGSRGRQQCRLSQRTAQAQGTQSKHKGN